MVNRKRHQLATISMFGISYMHRQNPFVVAWWSAAFPGFGQYLLNQYLRATLFTISEVATNTLAHINECIAYSFSGNFEMAKSVLRPQWAYGYFILYLFAIWDSYRSTLVQNKMCHLAEMEDEPIQGFLMHPFEIQYLEQKNPFIASWYSLLLPGLGQLYNHRFGLAFYSMFWWWVYFILSHAYESIFYLVIGNIQQAVSVIKIHWLMFLPSVIGGAVYHAYITAVDHNRLYRLEQRQYLVERYGNSEIVIFP